MFTKRTVIGTTVGSVITAIGLFALVSSLGLQTTTVNETFGIGEYTAYQFTAPKSAHNFLQITGESFDIEVKTPANGLQIPKTTHKKEVSLDWYVLEEGVNRIAIQNTGQSQINVTGALQHSSDPILFTYHIMVIIAGVVIIGFSAGFSFKKPKGF